jgi:hypothetical protein
MNTGFLMWLLGAVLPLATMAQHVPDLASDRSCTGIYSAVRLVPEVDDYVGSEIVIWRCTLADVVAEWRLYEGGHEPQRLNLHGTLVKNQLTLLGRTAEGSPVEIHVTLQRRRLLGTALVGHSSKVTLRLPSARFTWAERMAGR